ncbi:hypothetical protein SBY92_002863 [Candida maltosa Xu316]|uniref:Uncharacterized protein n=1 Tax=Candida maltosa (strain Xu316) TaxID=1245528 RepID=M3J5N3_CANMX|nr:hypothetical protein G210_2302 [Candida maltosa Xu316]
MFLSSLVFLLPVAHGYLSNIPEINNLDQTPNIPGQDSSFVQVKTPQNLLFTGDYVCDKYSSLIQSVNDTTEFPIAFDIYVSQTIDNPDNYTLDLYFKNPWHQSYNTFTFLNVTDSTDVLSRYNPTLISHQEGFGVEFKFQFSKGLLCQFMYQFTIAYQMVHQNDTDVKSDKIFLSGSCQENQRYYPDSYAKLVSEGFRCVEYNSGFKYDGGKDWCSEFYPDGQCCKSYRNDEIVDRNTCPRVGGGSDVQVSGEPVIISGSSVVQGTLVSDDKTTTYQSVITIKNSQITPVPIADTTVDDGSVVIATAPNSEPIDPGFQFPSGFEFPSDLSYSFPTDLDFNTLVTSYV